MQPHVYFDLDGTLTDPYEGIHDTLARVADLNCRMFVATSKPRIAAKRIVDHFEMGQYFDTVYGCELDGTRANKVDLLAYAVEQNPVATFRVMIGDRKHDLLGAVANDIKPLGVSYGYGSVDELNNAGAAEIAHTTNDLGNIIARWLS